MQNRSEQNDSNETTETVSHLFRNECEARHEPSSARWDHEIVEVFDLLHDLKSHGCSTSDDI